MKFEFGKYTEVTSIAHEMNSDYEDMSCVRVFICPDVWDFWFVRVLENINEDYEHEEGVYLIERNKVDMDYKGQELTYGKVIQLIKEDDFSNWDVVQCDSMEDVIDVLDDGFGVFEE